LVRQIYEETEVTENHLQTLPVGRPIFVVGSPRSGTSILTWCLGQHPNILTLEESSWLVDFAVDLAVGFKKGSRRGPRSQVSSMGMSRERLMEDVGRSLNQTILSYIAQFEELCMKAAEQDASGIHPGFKIARTQTDPKTRWADGTPEYSTGINALRKLFPQARFIHLLRNVDDVVRSMVHFDRVAGTKLVESETEGYNEWLRMTRACLEAEKAYGPTVVKRLHYDELITDPEKLLRSALEFVGEAFCSTCLEPLAKRINSSRVPTDAPESGLLAGPAVVSEARELWNKLRETPPPLAPSIDVASRLDEAFEQRVEYIHDLDAEHNKAQQILEDLQKELQERAEWTLRLDQEIVQKNLRILQLQEELSESTKWATDLAQEVERKDVYILQLQKEFEERTAPPPTSG
jgi:hypothetical protein